MARKPAILELATGKGNRQRAWEAIRARKGAEWTRVEIAHAAKVEGTCLETYMQGLLAAEIIRETRREKVATRSGAGSTRGVYVLERDCGVEAPRVRRDGSPVTQGLAQEQMWRTLRLLKGDVNAHELAAHATSREVPVSPVAAGDYLLILMRAGYLELTAEVRRNPRNPRLNSAPRYRLKQARNTGPKPPMVCRTNAVFDANENKVVWQAAITEEDVIYGR